MHREGKSGLRTPQIKSLPQSRPAPCCSHMEIPWLMRDASSIHRLAQEATGVTQPQPAAPMHDELVYHSLYVLHIRTCRATCAIGRRRAWIQLENWFASSCWSEAPVILLISDWLRYSAILGNGSDESDGEARPEGAIILEAGGRAANGCQRRSHSTTALASSSMIRDFESECGRNQRGRTLLLTSPRRRLPRSLCICHHLTC